VIQDRKDLPARKAPMELPAQLDLKDPLAKKAPTELPV
jgi:hypothetical protein